MCLLLQIVLYFTSLRHICFIDKWARRPIMAEKSVCSINCLGCHLGMTWRGLMGQEPKRSTENEPLSKPSGSTPDSCITPACLKSWLCVGGCHTKKLAWFYGLVLILALLCIAAVPALVFLRGARPGQICKSDSWEEINIGKYKFY